VVYQVPRSFVVPVNFGLFMLGNIWQAALALDALRMKNVLELYSICVLNFCLCVFSIMRYFQTWDSAIALQQGEAPGPAPFTDRSVDYWAKAQPALLVSAIIVGICAVASCIWAFFLQREFRWAIYRHISGSLEMLRRYLAYQVRLPFSLNSFLSPNPSVDSLGSSSNRTILFDRIRYNIWIG
jgi:hypothetical protein